jgi:hypothetical protein
MSKTQQISLGVVVVALLSVTTFDAALAASRGGIAAPKLHKQTIVQAREIQVASTGDGISSEADCKKREAGINSWADEEVAAMERGDEAGSRRAKFNTEALISDATDAGCFVIY